MKLFGIEFPDDEFGCATVDDRFEETLNEAGIERLIQHTPSDLLGSVLRELFSGAILRSHPSVNEFDDPACPSCDWSFHVNIRGEYDCVNDDCKGAKADVE